MVGSISANTSALLSYGKEMATVSDRVSKAFRGDGDVNVVAEFANATRIEHGHSANLKLIRVQGDMLDSVLDILA